MKRKICFGTVILIISLVFTGCIPKTEQASLPFIKSSRDSRVDMNIEVDCIESNMYEVKFELPFVDSSTSAKIYIGTRETKVIPTTKENIVNIEMEEVDNVQVTVKYSAIYDYVFYIK